MSDSQQTAVKRSACDRCRTQKLRCIRVPGHPNESCLRCARSQMDCVSSSSKRPGRPRNSTNASKKQNSSPPTSTNDTRLSRSEPAAEEAPAPTSMAPAFDIPSRSGIEDWFNMSMLETDYDVYSVPWEESPFSMDIDGGGTMNSMFSLPSPSEQASTVASISGLLTDTSFSEPFTYLQSEQDDSMLQLFAGNAPSAPNLDYGLHLSVLQRDLSKQLFALKTMPWDVTKVMQLTCDFSNFTATDIDTNPLAKIANTCREFVNILCSIQSMTGDGNTSTKDANSRSLIHSKLSIPDLLTILSIHLLTISIYETIFSQFMHNASQDPNTANKILQSSPKFFLGGIAIPPQLDILSQFLYSLAGSQLQPIEMLLGLPDEYCVSIRRATVLNSESHAGLFSGDSGQLLLSTLMKVEAERVGEDRGGLGAIESLKEKMRHR